MKRRTAGVGANTSVPGNARQCIDIAIVYPAARKAGNGGLRL
jgi:hypothetical protein